MTAFIGLSGGIGSGKSTVSRILAELGATIVDADALVHEMQAAGQPMLREIAAAFGEEVLREDGSLDRPALGAIVFRDATLRRQLEEIVQPPVVAEMGRRARVAIEAGVPMVVMDIPLLFEGQKSGRGSAAQNQYDATVCVWVPVEVQIERTMCRDGCDRGEAERRVAAQMPIDEKRDRADHVIDNSGTPQRTRAQVEALYARLTSS
jgi:dephospho-CoA kinase